MLNLYAMEFGRNHVVVVSFEESVRKYGSPFKGFLAALGFPAEQFPEPRAVLNKSPSVFDLSVLRELALFAKLSGQKFRHDRERTVSTISRDAPKLPHRIVTVRAPSCVLAEHQTIQETYGTQLQLDSSLDLDFFCEMCIEPGSGGLYLAWKGLVAELLEPSNNSMCCTKHDDL